MNVKDLLERKTAENASPGSAVSGTGSGSSSFSKAFAGALGMLKRFLSPSNGAEASEPDSMEPRPEQATRYPVPAPGVPGSDSAPEESREKIGWFSPCYTHSRSVTLNPETLIANRCVAYRSESPEADSYRVLRTRLLKRIRETGGNTVMVTSALPGEGKTLTAINLALICAREFHQTVLLVDGDLRRQKIHRYLGYPSNRGLIDYLLNDAPIQDVMVWPGIEKMTVISGGRTVAESSELLGSRRMRELVAEMKQRYPDRILFFDTPPVLTGADAIAFAPLVDHILVTARSGATQVPDLHKAIAMLPGEKIAGLVLNRQPPEEVPYYKTGG